MAMYMGLLTLSAQGAERVVRDGPTHYREHLDRMVKVVGGTLAGLWVTNVGDWDLVVLMDLPDGTAADGAAATLLRKLGGAFSGERWIRLISVDEAQAALERLTPAT